MSVFLDGKSNVRGKSLKQILDLSHVNKEDKFVQNYFPQSFLLFHFIELCGEGACSSTVYWRSYLIYEEQGPRIGFIRCKLGKINSSITFQCLLFFPFIDLCVCFCPQGGGGLWGERSSMVYLRTFVIFEEQGLWK